jgi:hypothetical protein
LTKKTGNVLCANLSDAVLFAPQSLFVLVGKRNNKLPTLLRHDTYTDKKGNEIFLIYKEIQKGSVAKSYMTKGLLIYG